MSKKIFFISGLISVLIFSSCSTVEPENETVSDSDKLSNDESLPDSSENDNSPLNDEAEIPENDPEETDEFEDDGTVLTDDDHETEQDVSNDEDADNAPELCADLCLAGTVSEKGTCTLWDDKNSVWVETIEDGDGNMHNRARNFVSLLHEKMMPYGGVFRTFYTDATYTTPFVRGGSRDAPIWVGSYIASEAFRYMATKAPNALKNMDESVRTLDLWWRITANKGYLARYVAPADAPEDIQKIFAQDVFENHKNFSFENKLWHWKGDISRDQYQGVMFGFSLAYDVLEDEVLKETIRSNIVNTVEQLMEKKVRKINIVIDGAPAIPVNLELEYVIPQKDSEIPRFEIKTNPFEMVDATILYFWPNPPEYLRKIPGLSWLPDVPLRSQAIQLASFFEIALHVTKDIPEYAARRQAILSHFAGRFQEWRNMGATWENSNDCGDSYHGLNIAFLPAFNWVRLEEDYFRKTDLQNFVLRDRMWEAVKDHKNVFFSYIYTSQANPADNTASIITQQTDQLRQFPPAPYLAVAVDNTAKYPENSECSGLAQTAIDVGERVPASFLWEKNPWKLKEDAIPNFVYPGVDYLIAYWMARYYGYLEDDAPDTCLRWKE